MKCIWPWCATLLMLMELPWLLILPWLPSDSCNVTYVCTPTLTRRQTVKTAINHDDYITTARTIELWDQIYNPWKNCHVMVPPMSIFKVTAHKIIHQLENMRSHLRYIFVGATFHSQSILQAPSQLLQNNHLCHHSWVLNSHIFFKPKHHNLKSWTGELVYMTSCNMQMLGLA